MSQSSIFTAQSGPISISLVALSAHAAPSLAICTKSKQKRSKIGRLDPKLGEIGTRIDSNNVRNLQFCEFVIRWEKEKGRDQILEREKWEKIRSFFLLLCLDRWFCLWVQRWLGLIEREKESWVWAQVQIQRCALGFFLFLFSRVYLFIYTYI